jgi:hypothetical protein
MSDATSGPNLLPIISSNAEERTWTSHFRVHHFRPIFIPNGDNNGRRFLPFSRNGATNVYIRRRFLVKWCVECCLCLWFYSQGWVSVGHPRWESCSTPIAQPEKGSKKNVCVREKTKRLLGGSSPSPTVKKERRVSVSV